MSWSVSIGPVRREAALAAIADCPKPNTDGPGMVQFQAAKLAASELVKIIPGAYVSIGMAGHANGKGWESSGDSISCNVYQCQPPPPPPEAAEPTAG